MAQVGQWTLIIVVVLLAWIGLLHLTRGTAVRHVRAVGSAAVAAGDPQFPLNATLLTGAWLAPGNRVEVTLNGDGTYARLREDLLSAQQSITLQLYYGNAGRAADVLHDVLLDRAGAGVPIFLLCDAFGSTGVSRDHLVALRKAGVRVEPFRPLRLSTLHLAQNRSHVRGIVVDARVAWTGGFGIDSKWLGDGHTDGSWRKTNVRFEGPTVLQLQAAFAAAWAEATGAMFTPRANLTVREEGRTMAGLLYATPRLGTTPAERFFALSITAARKTLYITNPYFVPDEGFIGFLGDAARRGVDVRILTSGPRTDVPFVRLAGRAMYDRLLTDGVRVYEWQPSALHAKTFVVDGAWSTVGTMNFDNRSMALNEEATLMIHDTTIGEQMEKIFIEDLRYAEEIKLDRFRQRPWFQRIGERGTSLFRRLL